jgi:demethylmenaquinone methyltransferase/2-methoxy-6-polyprenyl-1,4-benzoquinol methylase
MQKEGLSMHNDELPFIRDMFDNIAPRYDLLNRLLSLRQDVYWRRKMVAGMHLSPCARVLDVACGTGDVALEVLRQKGDRVQVVGVDFSPGMLVLGSQKVRQREGSAKIPFLAADAFKLPFGRATFDAVTMAFGIRNIQDKLTVLKAFHDCLKPGGELCILELATPQSGLLRRVYMLYFEKVLPRIGGLFSRNIKAYRYLPSSVIKFPAPEKFAALMGQAGFTSLSIRRLTFGVATLFSGIK